MPVYIQYVYEYPICALLILTIVLCRFFAERQLPVIRSRMFAASVIVACADVIFDILSSYVIENPTALPIPIAYTVMTVFYLLQMYFPSAMVFYVFSATKTLKMRNLKQIFLTMLPCTICGAVILINPLAKWLFYFQDGLFYRGNAYPLLIAVSVYCSAFCVVYALIMRKNISDSHFLTISVFSILLAGALAIQVNWQHILLTSVAISIGMLVYYLELQRPETMVDHLTGLLNMDAMMAYIDELAARETKYQVLVFKVENIRRINSIFGYTIGSLTLQSVADFLTSFSPDLRERSRARKKLGKNKGKNASNVADGRKLGGTLPEAWAFRLISNQFAVVSTNSETHDALLAVLRDRFEVPWYIRGLEMNLLCTMVEFGQTESFGSGDDLYKAIETMLPAVPKGDTVSISAPTLLQLERNLSIENALSKALEENRLQVHFQPVYSVREEKFTHLEALVRFEHAEYGDVSPDEFIPIAEKRGLVMEIDEFVLRRVCEFIKNMEETKEMEFDAVSVNISVTELASSVFPMKVCAIVDEYKIPHRKIMFEITEAAIATSYMLFIDNLQVMSKLGFEFVLDNYGTGGINVAHLVAMPFSVVKIDRAFLQEAQSSPKGLILFENAIDVLRKMEIRTVVVGAETVEQSDMIIRSSADYIQGFYYSRPMARTDLVRYIQTHPVSKSRVKGENIIVVKE